MIVKSKFARAGLAILLCAATLLPIPTAHANSKLPLLDTSSSFRIPNTAEVIGLNRIKENWVVAGIDSEDKSWVGQYTRTGEEIWRVSPLVEKGGGEGFITAFSVDGQSTLLAGISQSPLSITTAPAATTPAPSVTPSVTPSIVASASPTSSATGSATGSTTVTNPRNVPLVNPDNVIPGKSEPRRSDIKNIFVIRLDNSGKVVELSNTQNERSFIPTSVTTRNSNIFVVGNQMPSDNTSRGALYIFKSDGSSNSFSFGSKQTRFNRVLATSATSITVVGSSADTLAGRAVAGRVDGVILTLAQSTGEVTNVLRSSGKGAMRSWDFATGNLLVSGTSRSSTTREAVVTSFTSKATVSWTKRYPKSVQALASGSCIAVETSGSEVLIYRVDSKGKELKGARIPRHDLLAVATTDTKGCAILSAVSAGEFRVSYL